MNILAVNWLDLENPLAGGAEIHFFEIFKRLVHAGDRVTLLCSGWRNAPPRAIVDGIDVVRLGGRHSFAGLARRATRVMLATNQFDVVVEDVNKLPLYLANLTALPTYIIIPHLFGATVFREASWPVALLVWLAERPIPWVYRRSVFQAISNSTRDDLVRRGVPPGRIRVINPGVDNELYAPASDVARWPEPTFLYVGRLKRYKGVDTAILALVQLLRAVPNARLQVAGTGDDRPRLERIAARHRVGHAVDFLGFVTEARKIELLRRAWALVFPSAKEGWGIANVEAAACATPAVAADRPGLRDSVIDGTTGLLVKYGSVTDLTAAMARLASDPALVERMGRGAREFATRLTWADAAAQTRAHLMEAIGSTTTGEAIR